ncbi:MAG: BMP family ABC transporter substrate-binding protein [Proteobacteria bacterium]|nr:BMP family ABC transporter substrate-binding protein [Pseudomonadota bacterium]
MNKMVKKLIVILSIISLMAAFGCGDKVEKKAKKDEYKFGLIMVGPHNDHGWSQAHYEGGEYVEKHIPGTKMIYIDKVNPADRPGVTIPQIVDDMVEKGAKFIIANSDDMSDGTLEAAKQHPDVSFIHISGDHTLTGKAPKNLGNLMGKMEYGKMMAGYTAALTSKTGKIGFLGPLLNDETRRLASAAYLGAKYAWEEVLKKDPKDLKFEVIWIGFWFNIPGVTADPTQVTQNFYNKGCDVVISGIDTTEATIVADQERKKGKKVWAVPYDYKGACKGTASSCLGVPYFNWGPSYVKTIKAAMAGKFKSEWVWVGPDWKDINNENTSAVGFEAGAALSAENKKQLDQFIVELGSGKLNLFKGPLNYQDGSVFLKKGEVASDKQIWYMKQLLKGMIGQSSTK